MAPARKWRKVVISYPPVPTRKWRSPFKPHKPDPFNRKPIRRLPLYPSMHPVPHSSLLKIWHWFFVFEKNSCILRGRFACNDPRFILSIRGKQATAMCMVALGYTRIKNMKDWNAFDISNIMNVGAKLYMQSVYLNKNTCDCTHPKEVHPTYFINDMKFVLRVEDEILSGTIIKQEGENYFRTVLKKVFNRKCQPSGIKKFSRTNFCLLEVEGKYMAIWKEEGAFYLFDPFDRDVYGMRTVTGTGVSVVLMFIEFHRLVSHIQKLLCPINEKKKFTLHRIYIKKFYKESLLPPDTFEELDLPEREKKPPPITTCLASRLKQGLEVKVGPIPKPPDAVKKKKAKSPPEIDYNASTTPSYSVLFDEEKINEFPCCIPTEKPTPPPETYYITVIPGRMGILIGSHHQNMNKTCMDGKQSLGSAIAAAGMLRIYKSKFWYPKLIDEMILTGETIYLESRKKSGDTEMTLQNVVKKFTINSRAFLHNIDENTVIGQITSEKNNVLDLKAGLREFFADNDVGIIRGPVTVCVWLEEGFYYMFDPNERDSQGRVIDKEISLEWGTDVSVQGFACVTSFARLEELVKLYLWNLSSAAKKEHYYISRIEVLDFLPVPSSWHCFDGLKPGKWILRATYSQNSNRFPPANRNTQCTVMAVVCIAISKVVKCNDWDRPLLDDILVEGDKLYQISVDELKAKEKFISKKLLFGETHRKYYYENRLLNLILDECVVNGALNMKPTLDGIPDLNQGMKQFFKDYDAGVLTCKELSFGFWKYENHYFYFDSHGRDENGYVYEGGLACVLRFECLNDMVEVMLANLNPARNEIFNLGAITVTIWEKTAEGTVKPDFFAYIELSDKKGIVRATSHQGDVDLFDVNADKQTLPNMLTALAMSTVLPCSKWTTNVLDQILIIGDSLYEDSRFKLIEQDLNNANNWESEEKPMDVETITFENVLREVRVGINKVTFEFGEPKEGIFEPERVKRDKNGNVLYQDYELQNVLWNALETIDNTTKSERHEIIIDSEHVSFAIWKEEGLYYLFDPKGKDKEGNFFGRDLWSAKIIIRDEDYSGGADDYNAAKQMDYPTKSIDNSISPSRQGSRAGSRQGSRVGSSKGSRVGSSKGSRVGSRKGSRKGSRQGSRAGSKSPSRKITFDNIYDEDEDEDEEWVPSEIDISDAKACTIMFTTFDDIYVHIIENVRPNKRTDHFKLYPIHIYSMPILKPVTNPQDKTAGNWYQFEEVEVNTWILRGKIDIHNETFPPYNRGKQHGAMCVFACAYCRLYALPKFKSTTVDYILKYGDRLHTAVRKHREEELKANRDQLGFNDDEIMEIVGSLEVRASEIIKQFFIGEHHVFLEIEPSVVHGDVKKKEKVVVTGPEPVSEADAASGSVKKGPRGSKGDTKGKKKDDKAPSVKEASVHENVNEAETPVISVRAGITQFMESNNFGILTTKGVSVAIMKIVHFYYLFDPESRGPSGLQEVNGTAMIMRFAELDTLIDIVEENIPIDGSNDFQIDSFAIHCKRAQRPKPSIPAVLPLNPNMTAYREIHPDKQILRGNFHQDNPKFKLTPNATGACNALVALAMSMIHPPEAWSKPIVDDILVNAHRVYKESVIALGHDFNEWEDSMGLDNIQREFKVGVMHVDWVIVLEGVQRGIVVIKDPDISNLRRGCEQFFMDYTTGIIQTIPLTVAIWKCRKLFYMFDPNPRGPTGLHTSGGTACVLIFISVKQMVDHFLENIPPRQYKEEFAVFPIQMHTKEYRLRKVRSATKADLLKSVKDIDSLAGFVDDDKPKDNKKKLPDEIPVYRRYKPPKSTITCNKKDKYKYRKEKSTKEMCCCPDKSQLIPNKTMVIDERRFRPEEKKELLRELSGARKLKDLKAKEGRLRAEFYALGNGEAIVRAHFSQNSSRFHVLTRNKQTHCNALVAIVMSKLHDPKTWSYKNIEIILESGDILYKGSYMKFRPKNELLGLKNLLRVFYIYHLKITTNIYKPFVFGYLQYEDIYVGLLNFFMQETAGILITEYDSYAIAVFQKSNQYYMFDPHDRDVVGEITEPPGCACLMKFQNLENLVTKFMKNTGYQPPESLDEENSTLPKFTVCAVAIENVEKKTKKVPLDKVELNLKT